MSGYLPISFIEEKVRDLENALFFSMSDAVLKIPTCVIKVLGTDELGHLWFVVPKPSQLVHAFDKIFPVKLDFFRKGRDYYLKILGKAFLVNDPEEINMVECLSESTKQQARENETILIRVQMTHVDYVEKTPVKANPKTLLHHVKNKIYRWFQLSDGGQDFQKVPVDLKYPSISSFTN
jgi:general stress protein 26